MSSQFVKLPLNGGGGGSGANATLSNLTSPTSVNQDLLSTKATWTVGSAGVTSVSNSTNVALATGDNMGAGGSGNLNIKTGSALMGMASISGTINISSGQSMMTSGAVTIATGSAPVRGNINLQGANIDASASTGFFRVPFVASDPAALQNGAIWYNSTTNKLRAYINGAAVDL